MARQTTSTTVTRTVTAPTGWPDRVLVRGCFCILREYRMFSASDFARGAASLFRCARDSNLAVRHEMPGPPAQQTDAPLPSILFHRSKGFVRQLIACLCPSCRQVLLTTA